MSKRRRIIWDYYL